MTAFAWSDVYAVGVESVDLQHRALAETLNRIEREITDRAPIDVLHLSFEGLYRQTADHFRHEEALFSGTRYHRARNHKREHEGLLLILRRYCDSLDQSAIDGKPGPHIKFLRQWLIDHIRNEDYVMAVHLNSLPKR